MKNLKIVAICIFLLGFAPSSSNLLEKEHMKIFRTATDALLKDKLFYISNQGTVHTIYIYDIESKKQMKTIDLENSAFAITIEGNTLYALGRDFDSNGILSIYNLAQDKLVRTLKVPRVGIDEQFHGGIRISKHGDLLLITDYDTLLGYDLRLEKIRYGLEIQENPDEYNEIFVNKISKGILYLAGSDKMLRIINPENGLILDSFNFKEFKDGKYPIYAVDIAIDGDTAYVLMDKEDPSNFEDFEWAQVYRVNLKAGGTDAIFDTKLIGQPVSINIRNDTLYIYGHKGILATKELPL